MPQRNPAGKTRDASRAPDGTVVADVPPKADAPTMASWRRVNRGGMGNSWGELLRHQHQNQGTGARHDKAKFAKPIRRELGRPGHSHSASFDRRCRPETFRTAMATVFFYCFQCLKKRKTCRCSAPLSCHTSNQDFNRSSHGGSWGRQVPRAGRVYAGGVK